MLVEQRPRMQSRGEVVPLESGRRGDLRRQRTAGAGNPRLPPHRDAPRRVEPAPAVSASRWASSSTTRRNCDGLRRCTAADLQPRSRSWRPARARVASLRVSLVRSEVSEIHEQSFFCACLLFRAGVRAGSRRLAHRPRRRCRPLPQWFVDIDTAKKGEVSRADFLKHRMKVRRGARRQQGRQAVTRRVPEDRRATLLRRGPGRADARGAPQPGARRVPEPGHERQRLHRSGRGRSADAGRVQHV